MRGQFFLTWKFSWEKQMQMTSVHAHAYTHTVSFDVQETKYKKSRQSQDKQDKRWKTEMLSRK